MKTPRSFLPRSLFAAAIAVLAALLIQFAAPSAFAVTYYWDTNSSTAGFGTAGGNWGAPTPGPTPGWSTNSAGTAIPLSVTTTTSDPVNFGFVATGLGAGTITLTGARSSGNMTFASGSGAIVLSGGTNTLPAAATITVNSATHTINSALAGAATSLTIAGSGTLALNGINTFAGQVIIGNNVANSLKLQVNNIQNLNVASSLGKPATAAKGVIQIGDTSNPSTLEFTGASAAASTDRQIQIGSSANGSGGSTILNNSANTSHTLTFTQNPFNVASTGVSSSFNRTLTLGGTNTGDNEIQGVIVPNTGGTTTSLAKSGAGTWVLGGANTYSGNTTISAGTLVLKNQHAVTNSSVVMSGGTLAFSSAVGANAFTLGGLSGSGNIALTNSAGTAIALSSGFRNVGNTYSGVLSEGGSLIKVGTLTLTLTGANSYSGTTTVSEGKLVVSSTHTGTGAAAVSASATLGVIVSGTSQWPPASLTLANPCTLEFNSVTNSGTTTAPLLPTAAVGAVSGVTVNVTSVADVAVIGNSYPLLGNAGTTNGYTLDTQPLGVYGHLDVVGTTLVYVVDDLADVWTGVDAVNPTFWDIATSTNWGGNANNNSPAYTYASGDYVLFDDSAVPASPVTVSIQAAVAPSGVTFNNTTNKNYILTTSGANVIGGSGGLTKLGNGTAVLMGGAHTYSGATEINAGTLQLGDGTSGNDATIDSTSGVLNQGTLALNRFGSFTTANNITGSGKVTKDGVGTNLLTGNNVLNGVTVTGGTLEFSAGTTTNGSSLISVNDNLAQGSTLKFSGGSFTHGGASGTRNLSVVSNGTVLVSGTANVTFPGYVGFGTAAGSSGNLTMSGGTLNVNGADTANVNRALVIAEFTSETSTFDLTGGTVNVPNGKAYIGWAGTGIWNLSGGTANVQTLQLGGASSVLNLTNNGQINVGSGGIVTNAAAGAAINLNGGTLSSLTNWSTTANATIGGNVSFAPVGGHTIAWSGVLSGTTGSLTVSGPGTLALSGVNDYSGDTTNNAGRFQGVVGGSAVNSTVILNSATATNSVSIMANTKGWTNAAFTAAQAGVLEFDFSVAPGATVSPLEITGLADFTATPAVRIVLSGGSAPGTYPLMTWGSTSGNNPAAATLTVVGGSPLSTLSTNNNTLYVTVPVNVKANNILDLTNSTSWTANYVPGPADVATWDSIVLGANATSLGADLTWSGIQINNPGGLVTINGANTLTLGAASTDINMTNATADLTLNCNVALGAVNVWNVTNSRTLTVNGVISGSFNITNLGAGTVTLTGANTNTGTTMVNAGQFNINNRGAATMGTLNVVGVNAGDLATAGIGGGTLNFAANPIRVGGQGGGVGDGIVNQTNGTVAFTSGDMVVIAGGAPAGGAVGTYNLSGGSIDATGSAGGTANRGLLIAANLRGTGTFNLSGTGSLLLGTNTVQVTRAEAAVNGTSMLGTFNQTGGTAQMGFLSIGGSTTAKSTNSQAYVNLTGGTFVATNFLRLASGYGDTNAIFIGGTADVTLPAFPLARGTSSTNTLTLDGGTLRPLAASASYLQAGTFDNAYLTTNGAHIAVASGNNITVAQVLQNAPSQAGKLTKSDAGTLTLTGTNSYTGNTTISAGTLKLANDSAINLTSGLSIAAGATLDTTALSVPPPSSIPLTASGTGTNVGTTAAAIIGVSGFPHDMGTRSIILNYNGSDPALYLSAGTLNLNDNPFTINGSVLANGVYTIIAQSDAPAITGSVATSTVGGTALTGKTGTVSLSGNTVLLTVTSTGPSLPATLTNSLSGTTLSLSWAGGQGWRLLEQTNSRSVGLRTNWVDITPGSASSTNITVDKTVPTTFYRLVYP